MTAAVAAVLRLLDCVPDPEIPTLSIVDLGIVRNVETTVTAEGRTTVTVALTPTYSGCPATEVINRDVRAALDGEYDEVTIVLRRSPAWTTDWLSDRARTRLTGAGIAPPNGRAQLPLLISSVAATADSTDHADCPAPPAGDDGPAACPRCGAYRLTELAGFGSTPCQALWRCESCREPFSYFKVL